MASIAIIGTGYVGLVSGACLADFGNTVTCFDTDSGKIECLKKGEIPIYEQGLEAVVKRNMADKRLRFADSLSSAVSDNDVIFIAVGTPPREDGSADLSHVESAARSIGKLINSYKVVVNKSTVPIGTARKVKAWLEEEISKRIASGELSTGSEKNNETHNEKYFDVVSNPEFLREGSAVYDFTHPDRIIIGAESSLALSIMKDVYRSLYLNETPYIETNFESAETIKYASNAFLAVKITYINEIANLCEKLGADVKDVAKGMGLDGRISPKFLNPGPGYGGSCFPKDTKALARIGRDAGSPLSLVERAIAANENQKSLALLKIENAFGGSLHGKTAAILGLAFKPNTDDMRESPAITICQGLAEKGMKLRIYDPEAMKEAQWRLEGIKDALYFAGDEYDAIKDSDALVIITEWNQFRNLNLDKVKELLRQPYFFDLRNIYSPEQIESAGLRYFCTGRL